MPRGSRPAGLLCIHLDLTQSIHGHIEKLKFRSTTMARKGTDDKAKPKSGNRKRFSGRMFFSVWCGVWVRGETSRQVDKATRGQGTYEVKPFMISVRLQWYLWFCRTTASFYQIFLLTSGPFLYWIAFKLEITFFEIGIMRQHDNEAQASEDPKTMTQIGIRWKVSSAIPSAISIISKEYPSISRLS